MVRTPKPYYYGAKHHTTKSAGKIWLSLGRTSPQCLVSNFNTQLAPTKGQMWPQWRNWGSFLKNYIFTNHLRSCSILLATPFAPMFLRALNRLLQVGGPLVWCTSSSSRSHRMHISIGSCSGAILLSSAILRPSFPLSSYSLGVLSNLRYGVTSWGAVRKHT